MLHECTTPQLIPSPMRQLPQTSTKGTNAYLPSFSTLWSHIIEWNKGTGNKEALLPPLTMEPAAYLQPDPNLPPSAPPCSHSFLQQPKKKHCPKYQIDNNCHSLYEPRSCCTGTCMHIASDRKKKSDQAPRMTTPMTCGMEKSLSISADAGSGTKQIPCTFLVSQTPQSSLVSPQIEPSNVRIQHSPTKSPSPAPPSCYDSAGSIQFVDESKTIMFPKKRKKRLPSQQPIKIFIMENMNASTGTASESNARTLTFINYSNINSKSIKPERKEIDYLDSIQTTSDGIHQCKRCSKQFKRKSDIKVHLRKHTGERPFQCQVAGCTKSFTTASNLNRHKRSIHS